MTGSTELFFFKCSVSADLYGASLLESGSPLPTPGGGQWIPVTHKSELGEAINGFDENDAQSQIQKWGCHWFSSQGTKEIYWGPDGPPQ